VSRGRLAVQMLSTIQAELAHQIAPCEESGCSCEKKPFCPYLTVGGSTRVRIRLPLS